MKFKALTKGKYGYRDASITHDTVDICIRESKTIYQNYKHEAKKKNLSFNLSLTYLQELINKPCIYCGDSESNTKSTPKGNFKYNGIDRWNNNKGYEESNVVPCCKRCGLMKNDTEDGVSFIEHIGKIFQKYEKNIIFNEKRLMKYESRLHAIKSNSHDSETQVAAILIDPKTGAVIAEGYNGFIRGGSDDKLPNKRPEKYPYMVHAEINLICNAVRSGVCTDEKVLFCTLSPCVNCARTLYQAGINNIYFIEEYRDFNNQKNMLDLQLDVEKVGKYYKLTTSPRKL